MFISAKRLEREKRELLGASNRVTEAVLSCAEQGLLLIDAKGILQPQVSRATATLFRRKTFGEISFESLITPLVGVKTLAAARTFLAALLADAPPEAISNPLEHTDVRLPTADGTFEAAHYSFSFHRLEGPGPRLWLVRVSDITLRVQSARELDELRSQLALQAEILRSVLHAGPTRFAAFLQRTDASMKTINNVIKKPARAEDAFRAKLEETLEEVDRVRRDAAALKLGTIEAAARVFEDSLHELRSRNALSGSDFLPLAVKLDQLYGQFVSMRALTASAGPARAEAAQANAPRMTANGTQVIEAPKFTAERAAPRPVPGASRSAPAGSLENTLRALCEHVAQEHTKSVTLECQGLQLVPPEYQAAIKNVAIQLIRNAVMHGIEPVADRESARKPPQGSLRLEFKNLADGGFELLFEDDGRGLDPDQVRVVAIERGVITGEMAARLRDREAIKLIFKSGYSTLPNAPGEPAHGSGMSLVRRYVHETGGKIALASLQGHETRFKVSLPPLPSNAEALPEAAQAQSAH
jgi:chemotaxis protein histidine kinase CheA